MADNLVKIENCNNITECSFNITDGLLNIKYAINGTGKSTIAQSIKLSTEGKSLNELMPFGAKAKKDKRLFQVYQHCHIRILLFLMKHI